MPTQYVSTYRLRQEKLEKYLKDTFPGAKISVTTEFDDSYAFELEQVLTKKQKNEIEALRDPRTDDDD
ncbi:hypothetical protein F4808DRAFT_459955 [Astrocystis sublimbata]|nr:hypothetical protein F4808DRAFT_459955 [Astrocystis sublimbata]